MRNLSRPPLERMVRIHELVKAGGFPSTAKLAETLEVSIPTVSRDVEFMKSRMGLPLEYDPTHRGYAYTQEVASFPALSITEGELIAFAVARKALAQYRGTSFEKPLRSAFEKLTSTLQGQITFGWTDLDQAISFRAKWSPEVDLAAFDVVSKAVLASEALEFEYAKLAGEVSEVRIVEPLHLVCADGIWYLFALDLQRGREMRTFALGRMTGVRCTGRAFQKPADFSLETHLHGSFGIYSAPDPLLVRLRFDSSVAQLVGERVWHPSQEMSALGPDRVEVTMLVGLSPELERWILGWGEAVEVMEPAPLRTAILRHGAALVRLNGD